MDLDIYQDGRIKIYNLHLNVIPLKLFFYYLAYVKNHLQQNLNQVQKFILDAGVECTAELMQVDQKKSLGDSVLTYATKHHAELIIIMTKKEELSFSENISVTARFIINNSQIPVMSIRPKIPNYITSPTTAF